MNNLTPQTELRSRAIVERVQGPAKAVDVILIIKILQMVIPMMIDCFDPSDGAEASEYVKKRYNSGSSQNRYGGYDKRLVKSVARITKRAARRERSRITWDQAYDLGLATLDEIREGDDQQTSLVIREHDSFLLI